MAGPPPSGRQGYGLPPAGTGSFVDLLPPVVQPVAALGAGLVSAAGPLLHAAGVLLVGLARVAYRAVVVSSPLLIWVGTKYITWCACCLGSVKVHRVAVGDILKAMWNAPPTSPFWLLRRQVVGALGKVERVFKWGRWILGLLPKAGPPPA